ncbi:glycoside hydrolase family 75 protein [Fodinicola acaciae]|uniref:glycoside hydrolase family 75 protein n=1 Tax=Fodinicola acaciae TaxID=2681555 RepID=UPI0013CFC592|nr:glycoside hydrolase family 75 protein [Fodinicola acaciae]
MTKRHVLAAGAALFLCLTAFLAAPGSAQAATGPTAAQLKAKTTGCHRQVSSGKYAQDSGGSRNIPVCASGKAIYFTADLDVDCDGQRSTQCNKQTDPDYQPDTAYHQSNGKPLNAAKLPYIVLPAPSSIWNFTRSGIGGATVAAVVYKNKVAYAVVGDTGPTGIIGEGSYKLAKQLGINPSPSHGGVGGRVVTYILFPGVKASPIESSSSAVSKGQTAANAFVG